jgi:hypothetical protein
MKIIISLLIIATPFIAEAQMKKGRVVYERTMQMQLRFRGNEGNEQPPRTRTDQFELLFGNNKSLWQFLSSVAEETPGEFSSGGMVNASAVSMM